MDTLAAEYGWRLADILSLPLSQALCLQAAILERHDIKTGQPSFAERDLLAQMKATPNAWN